MILLYDSSCIFSDNIQCPFKNCISSKCEYYLLPKPNLYVQLIGQEPKQLNLFKEIDNANKN